jgi:hypothetical protein
MSAEAAIYPTPNSVSNRFLQNRPKPNNQINPKINPAIRSSLLKKTTNPVKKNVRKQTFETG